jgi:hypothetical protein
MPQPFVFPPDFLIYWDKCFGWLAIRSFEEAKDGPIARLR